MALKSPRRGVQSIRRHYSAALGSFPSRSFYVDATLGNDANSGTYPGEAWQTIGKVNGESFLSGDRILFKRGETWNTGPLGRNLVPPSSGIAGSPIIFGAYGTGADPIIDGTTSGSAALRLSVNYVIVQDFEFDNTDDHVVRFQGAQNCILQDCDIHDGGWACVYVTDVGGLTTANNIIRRNTIYDSVHEGVYVKNENAGNGTSNTLIEGNTIHSSVDECVQNTFDAPATAAPTGTIIRGNTVYDGGDVGLMQLWGNVLVELNLMYGTGGDWGVVYIENSDGAIVQNNLIRDYTFNNANATAAIRFEGTTTNISIFHNTIYGIVNAGAGDGIGIHCNNGGVGGTIENNGISGCDDQMMWWPVDPPDTADRNAVFGVCSDTGTNAVVADPLLVNPGADDLHLQVGSPCRGAGAVGTGVTDDYDGVARPDPPTRPDIGAYQFVP